MSSTAAAAARGLLIAHLILSPLVFSGATIEAFETNKAALLAATAFALAALGGLALRPGIASSGPSWLREPVTLSALAFLASATISTANSNAPLVSFFGAPESCSGLVTVIAYAVLFLTTRGFCRTTHDAIRLQGAIVLAAALSAAFGLLQASKVDPFLWADASHVAGFVRPFAGQGHANFLGAYLVAALPAVVALGVLAFRRGALPSTVVLACVAVVSAAALVATLSRGAWVACGATALVAAIGARKTVRARWWVVGLTCVVIAAATFRGGVVERLTHFGDAAGRFELWRAGLEMWRDNPLTGVGLDGYQAAFGQYRPIAFWKLEWNATPNKAHNEFIHTLATQGILGGIASIAFVAALTVAGWKAWRRGDATSRLVVAAAGLGAFAFLIQNQFSFTVAGCGPLFVTLAAIIVRGAEGFDLRDRPVPEWKPALAIAVGLVALVFVFDAASIGIASGWKLGTFAAAMSLTGLWTVKALAGLGDEPGASPLHIAPVAVPWILARGSVAFACLAAGWFVVGLPYRADRVCREADVLFDSDPTAAVALYERAVELAPVHDLYWAKLAEACRRIETRPRDAEERTTYGRRAREAAQEAVRLDPRLAQRHATLGQILGDLAFDGLAKPEDALASFDAALALDPRNAAILADAGRAAWGLNRLDAARRYLRRGLDLDPAQANLTALSGSVAMAQGHFEEAESNFRDARALDWHGDEDARLHALAAWGACLARLNQPIEAESWLRYVLDRRPDWVAPRFTLAFSMTLSNRYGAADEFRRVVAEAPNHPLAADARKWLQKLENK